MVHINTTQQVLFQYKTNVVANNEHMKTKSELKIKRLSDKKRRHPKLLLLLLLIISMPGPDYVLQRWPDVLFE
jgi:hypothetical protein